MSADSEKGKREIEQMVLDQFLDSFPIITGRTLTDEWSDHAEQVEGSPDYIIGLDGRAFGIELTEIRDAGDVWDYIAEAYRLASQKSESYTRRGVFSFPIALVTYSTTPALFDMRKALEREIVQADFDALGFSEVWAVDFSDAFYSAGHPLRRADMFCFKPIEWFGFRRIDDGDRKPYG